MLAFLNSDLFEFYKINNFVAFGDARSKGRYKLYGNKMEKVPIKTISNSQYNEIEKIVDQIIEKKTGFLLERDRFLSFIKNQYHLPKLTQKLRKFWNLRATEFLAEIKKKIKLSIKALKELSDLFLDTLNQKINPFLTEIRTLEKIINEFIFDINRISQKEKKFIKDFVNRNNN